MTFFPNISPDCNFNLANFYIQGRTAAVGACLLLSLPGSLPRAEATEPEQPIIKSTQNPHLNGFIKFPTLSELKIIDRFGNPAPETLLTNGSLTLVEILIPSCGPCREFVKVKLPIFNMQYQNKKFVDQRGIYSGNKLEIVTIAILSKHEISNWEKLVQDAPGKHYMIYAGSKESQIISKLTETTSVPYQFLINDQGYIVARFNPEHLTQQSKTAFEEINLFLRSYAVNR